MTRADVIVIGAGIAGASAAAQLSEHLDVIVLEAEDQPGYHATGRSAAYYATGYGNRVVRGISALCNESFHSPPAQFTDVAILRPRDCLFIARPEQMDALDAAALELGDLVKAVDVAGILERVSIIRPDYAESALLISGGGDIDVHELMQAYLRQIKKNGGEQITGVRVETIERTQGHWSVLAGDVSFRAPVVVNAAGAWADEIAEMAGLGALGIQPTRRSACLVDPPAGVAIQDWPLVVDAEENFYFKPETGSILVSPADETPIHACDVQPDDMDIAIAVDRFEKATTVDVRRVTHKWAGLRAFTADRTPVVGFDPRADGFFWLAGQGGYGVQTAPGLASLTAHLISGKSLPTPMESLKEFVSDLAPGRLL